jgi:hypothetical protein
MHQSYHYLKVNENPTRYSTYERKVRIVYIRYIFSATENHF